MRQLEVRARHIELQVLLRFIIRAVKVKCKAYSSECVSFELKGMRRSGTHKL